MIEADTTDRETVVSLGSVATLYCDTIGFPTPSVSWWRDDKMIALKTTEMEQRKDSSLLIHAVKLSNLGLYTCQAYNGVGKAVSWTVSLKTLGPVHGNDRDIERYRQYIINPPERPMPPTREQPRYTIPSRPRPPVTNAPPYQPPPNVNPHEIVKPPSVYRGNACFSFFFFLIRQLFCIYYLNHFIL